MKSNNNIYSFSELTTDNAFLSKPYDFKFGSDNREKSFCFVKKLFNTDKIATVHQVHSNKVVCIDEKNYNLSIQADGMITNVSNIALGIKAADCQAVYLYDSENKVIGNIHSGWKGTLDCILYNAIDLMINKYHCSLENIEAYFCPSICQNCFEVDKDVYLMFEKKFNNIDKYTICKKDYDKYYIDIVALNKDLLISYGLLDNNIHTSDICTKCNSDVFHSYRAEKDTAGRNCAFIMLK